VFGIEHTIYKTSILNIFWVNSLSHCMFRHPMSLSEINAKKNVDFLFGNAHCFLWTKSSWGSVHYWYTIIMFLHRLLERMTVQIVTRFWYFRIIFYKAEDNVFFSLTIFIFAGHSTCYVISCLQRNLSLYILYVCWRIQPYYFFMLAEYHMMHYYWTSDGLGTFIFIFLKK
jgi:hypothetical protein